MKIFVELVDSNGQIAAYRKRLGLYKDEIPAHMSVLGFYRRIVILVNEIRTLLKNKKGNEQKIQQLRAELELVIEGWRNV